MTKADKRKTGEGAMKGWATRRSREITLRDWFAGLAMQAAFAGEGARMVADRDLRYDETNWAEVVALNAYEMADAMLVVRNKATGGGY